MDIIRLEIFYRFWKYGHDWILVRESVHTEGVKVWVICYLLPKHLQTSKNGACIHICIEQTHSPPTPGQKMIEWQ